MLNNQGKNRAVMGVNEYGNGAVSTWKKRAIASERWIDYESQAEVGIYGIRCRDSGTRYYYRQIITPDIEAQNNGVFDQIQCNRLTVVNDSGEERISLSAPEKNAMLNFLDGDDIPISISHSDQHSRISLEIVIVMI